MKSFVRRRSVGLMVPRKQQEGYFDYENGGKWVDHQVTFESIEAVVVPAQADELKFDDGGAHVNLYKKVYSHEPLEKNSKVKFKGITYSVMQEVDYSHYAEGFRVYFIKRGDAND